MEAASATDVGDVTTLDVSGLNPTRAAIVMCSRSLEISGHNNLDFVNNTSPHAPNTMMPQTRAHATLCPCHVCSISTHSMGELTHTPVIYPHYSNTWTHSPATPSSNIIVVNIEPPTYTSSPDTTLSTTVIPFHTSVYVSEYVQIVAIQDAQNPLQNFLMCTVVMRTQNPVLLLTA